MQFTLYYRGPLKSKAGSEEKHSLRKHFHGQLKELWNQLPLVKFHKLIDSQYEDQSLYIIKSIDGFNFAPLVSEKLSLIAELDITLLRPEPPGSIILKSGDIDNRLKTLLDGLKVPNPGALPPGAQPASDEHPFFCLLEDDSLITRIGVTADRLLEADISQNDAVIQIHVTTKHVEVYAGTVGLG